MADFASHLRNFIKIYERNEQHLYPKFANNDKYIQLKALEVQMKAIEKWSGVLPTQMIPDATLPFINLNK